MSEVEAKKQEAVKMEKILKETRLAAVETVSKPKRQRAVLWRLNKQTARWELIKGPKDTPYPTDRLSCAIAETQATAIRLGRPDWGFYK